MVKASGGIMARHFVVSGPAQRKCGIVAPTYQKFLIKCRKKFNLNKDEIIVTLDDKTEVDEEYFKILVNGSKLFISKLKDFEATDCIHQLASFLHACLDRHPQLHNKIMSCLKEPVNFKQAGILLEEISKATKDSINRTSRTSKDNDEWFGEVPTKYETKEAFLRNNAETRMRNYLNHTKSELQVGNLPADSPQKNAIRFFTEKLRKSKYNASYFDRSAVSDERLCDSHGMFECEGLYDQDKCSGIHFINPYASNEARKVFSTWNFDHVIEKSRSIIPELKAALSGQKASSVNLDYFYDLLFLHKNPSTAIMKTNGNLKLVHIACHDKRPHKYQCESEKIFLDRQRNDVDGLGPQHDSKLERPGVKRPQRDSSYFTKPKKMRR